jgi:hypothetical protein
MARKTTFALGFCNRGFMPGELILAARREMAQAVERQGYGYLLMDENATRYGGVENTRRRADLCAMAQGARGRVRRSNFLHADLCG